jgi:hypothetical protein
LVSLILTWYLELVLIRLEPLVVSAAVFSKVWERVLFGSKRG